MLDCLKTHLDGVNGIVQIRGKGLMIGVELDRPCADVKSKALERGVLVNVTAEKVVRLLPPLVITDADADRIVSVVAESIRAFLKSP